MIDGDGMESRGVNTVRPPLAVLLAIAISLGALGLGGWWWLQRQSPLQLEGQRLETPLTASFLPRTANLSVVLEMDPGLLPAYGRAVAPARKRSAAAEQLSQLRDGLFLAAGLDYSTELADWLGEESSLSLRAGKEGGAPASWVMALTSRSDSGGRQFLQRFWQSRSLAGGDLEISRYRGLGVISSRGQQPQGRPSTASPAASHPPLATALVNDQLVLLASSRSALEEALDASQEDALNLGADPLLTDWLEQQPHGVALLRGDATGISQLMGLPAELRPGEPIQAWVGSLELQRRGLQLDAQAVTDHAGHEQGLSSRDQALLDQLNLPLERLSLSQPGAPLPALFELQAEPDDPLLAQLQASRDAAMLQGRLSDGSGWLAGSPAAHPAASALDAALAAEGFDAANLDELKVWSHLTGKSDRQGQLQAQVAGASGGDGELRWWSNNLTVLRQQLQHRGASKGPAARLRAIEPEAGTQALLGLDANGSSTLLSSWALWRGLQLMAGRPLTPAIEGMELALSEDQNITSLHATLHVH